MKTATAIAGMFVAAFVSAAPALAQIAPQRQLGSNIYVKPKQVDQNIAADMRMEMQRCYYNRERQRIDGLLAVSDPLTVDFEGAQLEPRRFFGESKVNPCLILYDDLVSERQMRFSWRSFRYMMVEEAYLARFPQMPLEAADAASPESARRYVTQGDDLASAHGLGAFSDCIVEADAEGADRIVRTRPGSTEEHIAATELVPALSGCIVEGQQYELLPVNIRAFAADGLWQRFVASSPVSTGGSVQ